MFINMCIFHVFTNWINHDKTSRHVAQVFSCPSASKRCVRFTPSPRSFQTETGCSHLELACWMVMTRNFMLTKYSTNHQISIKYDQIWIKLFLFSVFWRHVWYIPSPANQPCFAQAVIQPPKWPSARDAPAACHEGNGRQAAIKIGKDQFLLFSIRAGFNDAFLWGWCPCSDLMVNRCLVTWIWCRGRVVQFRPTSWGYPESTRSLYPACTLSNPFCPQSCVVAML